MDPTGDQGGSQPAGPPHDRSGGAPYAAIGPRCHRPLHARRARARYLGRRAHRGEWPVIHLKCPSMKKLLLLVLPIMFACQAHGASRTPYSAEEARALLKQLGAHVMTINSDRTLRDRKPANE